jgi:uncharacterized protein (DUF433 family)
MAAESGYENPDCANTYKRIDYLITTMKNRTKGGGRIVMDERVMVGKPVIKGTRITVEAVIRKLSEGVTTLDLLEEYPSLDANDVMAALKYAAGNVSGLLPH